MFSIITSKDRNVANIGKNVSITGYVKDSANSFVSGALVILTRGEVKADGSNVVKSTVTDSSGTFQFNDLISGSYGLAAWLNNNTLKIIKKKFDYLDTQLVFAGLDSDHSVTPATIYPDISGSNVSGIIVDNGGSGYSSVVPPIITFAGGYIGEAIVNNLGTITGARTIKQGDASSLTPSSTPTILTNITNKVDAKTYPSVAGTPGSGGGGLGDDLVTEYSSITTLLSNQARNNTLIEYNDSPWRITATADDSLLPSINWNAGFWSKAQQVQNDEHEPTPYFHWGSGLVAYKVGEIIVHPDSAATLSELTSVDGYYLGSTLLGGDNAYITVNLINVEVVSWHGVYGTDENGNEILNNPSNQNIGDWGSAITYPTGLLFNSKAEALVAIEQGNIARNSLSNINDATQADYQTDDDPTLAQQLKDFFSNKWEMVKNNLESILDPNDRYAAGQIYDAVKSEGLELYKQGLISEAELQIAKGFLGRDLIVAPVLANWAGYTGSAPDNLYLRYLATTPSLLLVTVYQIQDAATTEETFYEALFDGVTQNLGVLSVTPPNWIKNRTFNVGGINKQYINGSWVNI